MLVAVTLALKQLGEKELGATMRRDIMFDDVS